MNKQSSLVNVPPESLTQDWASHTLDMIGALGLVIAAVVLVSMALRHLQSKSAGGVGHLKVIQALSVGAKDRVLLVQVGVDQILMGVSSAGIQHLHTLTQPVELPASGEESDVLRSSSFATTFKSLSGKQKQ